MLPSLSVLRAVAVTYDLKGQQVHFDPGINDVHDNGLWIHNGNLVAECHGKEQQVLGSFEGPCHS